MAGQGSLRLQRALMGARQALKEGQPRRALELAAAALKLDPANLLALFVAGQAQSALGAAAAAADAFRRAVALTSGAAPGSHAHQLHMAAADNLLLECGTALPSDWLAALHDAPRLAALQAAIAEAVQAVGSGGARVLVCGGLGVEAVLAAQAGAAAVTCYCAGNPLTAALAGQLAADSGCGARVATATSAAQLDSRPGGFNLVVLADALGCSLDWAQLRATLAAAAPRLAPGAALLPHTVHVRGMLVQCEEADALNEVDAAQLSADTGGMDLTPANALLARPRRSVRLPSYAHTPLSSTHTLLTVPLASLLPDAAPPPLPSEARLEVGCEATADALCFFFEQQLLGGSEQPTLTADPARCQAGEAALHPHLWQHLQYLDRRQLAPGQTVAVRCELAGGSGSGSSSSNGGSSLTSAADAVQLLSLRDGSGCCTGSPALDLQLEVSLESSSGSGGSSSGSGDSLLLPVSAEQAAVAAAVPRYHTAMLNDAPRTAAYQAGIAAALREAEAAAAAQAGGQAGDPPLVLEIGSGSGLLCLLACQAGAAAVVGCERLPELQQAAECLLAANGFADRVSILPKHSQALTVAPSGGGGASSSGEAAPAEAPAADLPRRADVLMHEIFGTDPFSEGVVPSLVHAKQALLRPGAVLAPCRLHVVAAVAASASLHRLLHPPAAVCGGAVATGGALRPLAPRKVDCQVGQGGDLVLLTQPGTVLSVDFGAAELPLAGSATALLEALPRPLPLAAWAAAQRGAAPGGDGDGSAAAALPSLDGASLYAVSWFEYEFPGGVAGSSAPHMQRSEHWQQVVQPLEGDEAAAALDLLLPGSGSGGGGSGGAEGSGVAGLVLTAGYRLDRLWFELEGLAAAAEEEEEEEEAEA